MGLPDPRTKIPPAAPSIGRIVHYRSRRNPYDVPAVVTATQDSLWPEGVERGDVPALDSPFHVHLHVFTPGNLEDYQEHNIPFAAEEDGEPAPGSWRWPKLRMPGPPNPPVAPTDRPVG